MTRFFRGFVQQVAHSLNRRAYDREIAAELEAHVEMHTAENVRMGMDPAAARRLALMQLGGVQQTMEKCWDAGTIKWIARLLRPLS